MKNRIKIFVDGKSFTLVGEETEAHMQAVAAYIHEKITEIRGSATATRMDTSLAYVLTALNVADDFFKEKERAAELEGRNLGLRTRLEELTNQLDEAKAEIEELQKRFTQTEEVSLVRDEIPAKVLENEYPKEIVLIHPAGEMAEEIATPINQEEIILEKKEQFIPEESGVTEEVLENEYPKEIVLVHPTEEATEGAAASIAPKEEISEEEEQLIIKEVANVVKHTAIQRPQQRKSKRGRSRKR